MARCGIGLAVRLTANGMFQVEDVTANSPSQLCGFFQKGDLITAVDSTSVIGFTMDQFVDVVLGDPGSEVTVTVPLNRFARSLSIAFCRLRFSAEILVTHLLQMIVCRTL
jgi:C-terminal processing protease CtpA/Prc